MQIKKGNESMGDTTNVNLNTESIHKARAVAVAKNPSLSRIKDTINYILEDYAAMHKISVETLKVAKK